ncbi:MAG: type I methionyl aminopeptidase [Candidatus Omnitrophica bacterium]|nr:type I methionyl aminopeptidase [Candidatus Omnitrophota bacterium]
MISLKSSREIGIIRQAAEVLKRIFIEVEQVIAPGVTTDTLDQIAEKIIVGAGAIPAFKGYRGYPKTACISVNQEVVHGIPGSRKLREGDIVSFDIGAKIDGYYADAARTWPVGTISAERMKLLRSAQKSFEAALKAYKSGARIGDLSAAIQASIEEDGYQVVRDYVGHGIGRNLHEDPQVPNYGEAGRGYKIQDGLVLAIEPMVTEGHYKVRTLEDGWTVVTEDGKWASHYEDTVAFIDGAVVNLTCGEK